MLTGHDEKARRDTYLVVCFHILEHIDKHGVDRSRPEDTHTQMVWILGLPALRIDEASLEAG